MIRIAAYSFVMATMFFAISCFHAVSAANGEIVFLFSGPLILGLLVVCFAIVRTGPSNSQKSTVLKIFSIFGIGFCSLFFVGLHFQPFRFFPSFALQSFSSLFEMLSGRTPAAYMKRRDDLHANIIENLRAHGGKKIIFSEIETLFDWKRVCILGPLTTSERAREMIGMEWSVEQFSRITRDSRINSFIFFDPGEETVFYVIDLSRDQLDFIDSSKKCFDKTEAIFEMADETNAQFQILHQFHGGD